MSGIQFEEFVAAVLRGAGYEVNITNTTGDFGVDLIGLFAVEGVEVVGASLPG
jgi:HJR/Mrr/RecB family endonuclease